jgi:pyruvate dehydrogenase E2 component (dihydrolipoamide acetyltransferase)
MSDFLMPKLGADMTAGRLVAWRKMPGDAVRRGDILAEVDTDKGVIDIESFSEGILEQLLIQPGESVPVGTVLARIRSPDEPTTKPIESAIGQIPKSPFTTSTTGPPIKAIGARMQSAEAVVSTGGRLRISPAARRRSNELGIDPRTVRGTGPNGVITSEDVERAATIGCEKPLAPTTVEQSIPPPSSAVTASSERSLRMRQAIAAAMSRSNREIPHYFLSTTIDLRKSLDWLARQNEQRKVTERMLYGVLLLKATALALREVPELNGFWQDGRLQPQASIHVGVAIALRSGGLIAPAIHDVDRLSLIDLMQQLRDLVQRTRTGKLRSAELSDPTITVTSLGETGVECVYGVIYPPQVALVGFGKIVERPWCSDGQVVVRPLIHATLSGDHRATDGHRGSLFLAALDRLLQEPDKL